jgi:type VI secretion system protein ImpF
MTMSLLDRLTDLDPDSKKESAPRYHDDLRALTASLSRDLTVLLNTRRATEDFDPLYVEATDSLLTFGVADFTSYNLKGLPDQDLVRRSIERAIREFEPRLSRVSVSMEKTDSPKQVLRFQVSAALRTGSAGEDIMFDATLNRDSRRIAVSGANT